MSRRGVVAVVLGLLVLLASFPAVRAGKKKAPLVDLPSLEFLLGRLTRVAMLYRDNALRFTCNETISYAGHGQPKVYRFRYIYRHSHEDGLLGDYRVPRGRMAEMPEEKQEKIALENYGLPEYLLRAYSWIFLFDEKMQKLQQFEIRGGDDWQGTPAIMIGFQPLEAYEDDENLWYGTAWLDRETYQLLHIEAIEAEEYDQYRMAQRTLLRARDEPKFGFQGDFSYSTCMTDFDTIKHGMRFPGRSVIERVKYSIHGGAGKASMDETPEYKVIQTYGAYKFFSVRTEEQIRTHVEGED